jgi:RHS repeat-associated protein
LVPNRHGSTPAYRYGFNGKEKDDELKGEGNSYDFGARMLDPRIGRWFAVDKKYQKYPGWSPYNYVLNSPIYFVDPDGNSPFDWYKDKFGDYIYDKNIKSQMDLGKRGKYLGTKVKVETFSGSTHNSETWINSYDLNADGSVVGSFGEVYQNNFGKITITKGGIKIINNYTLQERLEDIEKSWTKASHDIEMKYQGEKGFYRLGDDLGKASTYVKIGSGIIAVGSVITLQPEGLVVAEGVYVFGDGLDNISTGIQISKDINEGGFNKKVIINSTMSIGNEIINNKIGNLEGIEKVSEIVTKVAVDYSIDSSKDGLMNYSESENTPDSNKIKE